MVGANSNTLTQTVIVGPRSTSSSTLDIRRDHSESQTSVEQSHRRHLSNIVTNNPIIVVVPEFLSILVEFLTIIVVARKCRSAAFPRIFGPRVGIPSWTR